MRSEAARSQDVATDTADLSPAHPPAAAAVGADVDDDTQGSEAQRLASRGSESQRLASQSSSSSQPAAAPPPPHPQTPAELQDVGVGTDPVEDEPKISKQAVVQDVGIGTDPVERKGDEDQESEQPRSKKSKKTLTKENRMGNQIFSKDAIREFFGIPPPPQPQPSSSSSSQQPAPAAAAPVVKEAETLQHGPTLTDTPINQTGQYIILSLIHI